MAGRAMIRACNRETNFFQMYAPSGIAKHACAKNRVVAQKACAGVRKWCGGVKGVKAHAPRCWSVFSIHIRPRSLPRLPDIHARQIGTCGVAAVVVAYTEPVKDKSPPAGCECLRDCSSSSKHTARRRCRQAIIRTRPTLFKVLRVAGCEITQRPGVRSHSDWG
eukprot:364507-Chlamydomonas_euryale.AAC.5